MSDLVPVRRALISVSDKSGLLDLARALAARGAEIISTGGTASTLRDAGIPVTPIDAVTGFPEILGGRVKTLHPVVHGGLLGKRDDASHQAQMAEHGIRPIDLVCVNLYPFERATASPTCTRDEAIENIDIGGPSMIRSAAKNHAAVAVLTDPAQYPRVLECLASNDGKTTHALRAELAAEAFARTSRYDAAIASYFAPKPDGLFPTLLTPALVKVDDLRHGENPHQRAALYRRGDAPPSGSLAHAEQLHGKDLSYNNLLDAAAALDLVASLAREHPGTPAAAVIKHTNPCGAALARSAHDAIHLALAGDPLAAYGGILAVGARVDESAAKRLLDREVFLEVIIAPGYDAAALDILRGKSANLRILAVGDLDHAPRTTVDLRAIPGGILAQERDARVARRPELTHRAGPHPSDEVVRLAMFLEHVGRSLFSNAVCLGGAATTDDRAAGLRLLGAGAGQMDRVTSCRLACEKAGPRAKGAVAYSDAFFPFDDGPRLLINAGVAAIVHTGGSKRDQDTFDLCEKHGVTCITTGLRHFRH